MNREIKFRVWNDTEGKWNGLQYKDPRCVGELICKNGIYVVPESSSRHFVVQQYTGLKDKNGTPIYEGDFIQYQYPTNDDCIKLKTKNTVLVRWTTEEEDNHPGFRIVDLWGQYGEMEVIGNNMENPELLKA
jgi:uncharacterized phage protein (TIGR01671 family)